MTAKSLPLGVLLLGVLPTVASAQGSLNPMVPVLQAELAEIERKIESLDCERLRDKAWGLKFEHFTDDQVSACAHTDIDGVLRNNQVFVDNLQCGAVGAQIGDVVTGTLPLTGGGSAAVTAAYGGGQVIVNAQPK